MFEADSANTPHGNDTAAASDGDGRTGKGHGKFLLGKVHGDKSHGDDSKRKSKILVMHASVGSGHRSAAEAIAYALQQVIDSGIKVVPGQPDDIEVEVLDSLDFARVEIDGNKTASGFVGPTRPIYDVTWRYFFTGRILWNGGEQWLNVMFPRFCTWVRENQPAAIICTHITAANIAVGARRKLRMDFPIICVPTDYEVEGLWPREYTDLFCAANGYMAETLRARRVPEERIKVTGIPANPQFSQNYDREAARDKWAIEGEGKTVLVLAGAHLPKPYMRLRNTLWEFLPYLHELSGMQFVFVTGHDSEYASDLRAAIRKEGIGNAKVLGYVDEIAELMAACDLVVCKAGGLTVTECLDARKPMILLGKAYGQEKINVRMLTARGAALHVQTARELFEILEEIESDDSMIKSLLLDIEIARRPYAALDIARASIELAYSPVSEEDHRRRTGYCTLLGIGDKPAHTR